MFSPLSLEIILALIATGAKGTTADELYSALRLSSDRNETNKIFSTVLPVLKSSNKGFSLSSANRIFIDQNFVSKNGFSKLATDVYDVDIQNLDFKNSVESSRTINEWVKQQTNDKIKNLISSSDVDANARLILVSTIYFNANWSLQFDPLDIKSALFYMDKKRVVEVDMMESIDEYDYYESKELNAQFLKLPYVGKEYSMIIVLPKNKEGLDFLEQNILDVLKPKNFTKKFVAVSLPKFKSETSIKLVPILKKVSKFRF